MNIFDEAGGRFGEVRKVEIRLELGCRHALRICMTIRDDKLGTMLILLCMF